MEGPTLPNSREDEFRPFQRRLPEFKFWCARIAARPARGMPAPPPAADPLPRSAAAPALRYSYVKAFLTAGTMTFFSMFDIPVFWPILLLYFITLFVLTMKRQIKHMIKYR